MGHLSDYIKLGALQENLKEISLADYTKKVISVSEFRLMDDEAKNNFVGIVTVDEPQWYATKRGAKSSLAKRIYSGDAGNLIGTYDKEKKHFLLAEVIDGKRNIIEKVSAPQPVNNKIIKEKEKTIMAEMTLGGTPLDLGKMSGLGEEALNGIVGDATKPMEEAVTADESGKKPSAAALKREENDAKIDKIKAKVSGQSLADRKSIISKNVSMGKLMGFVTKTDDTIKVSKAQVFKTQNGKKILKDDADQEIKDKHSKGEQVPAKYFVKRSSVKLRDANPGAIVGAVIATPEAGRIDLNDLSDENKKFVFDDSKSDLKYSFHTLEELYVILAAWYGGKIFEDDTVLGDRASLIEMDYVMYTPKSKDGTAQEPRFRTKLKHKKEIRKSLLTPGNFFPIKIYETINYQNLSEEDAKSLNYNFEAMLKKDDKNVLLNEFNAVDSEFIKKSADGVTSKVFAPGKSADGSDFCKVPAYYNKEENLTELKIAKRIKKVSDKGVVTYPFVYHKLDDVEHGPLSVPAYKEVFDNFHMDANVLINAIGKATTTNRSKAGKKLSTNDYLKAALKGEGETVGLKASISEMQDSILGLL